MTSSILALQRATHRTLGALKDALADLQLTPSETNALANLADGRPRSVRELTEDTGTKGTTLTGVLDRLERRGYLARELDPADRRSFRLRLTPSGETVATRIATTVTELEAAALKGLSKAQIEGFHAVLEALS